MANLFATVTATSGSAVFVRQGTAANLLATVTQSSVVDISDVILSAFNTLGGIVGTYTVGTPTRLSASFTCSPYTWIGLLYKVSKASSPTDIIIEPEISMDGTDFAVIQNDFCPEIRESSASVGTTTIAKALFFRVVGEQIRFKVTATGVSVSTTFTITTCEFFMRNGG